MKFRVALLFIAVGLTAGCSNPSPIVTNPDSRPRIQFTNATPNESVLVDNFTVGVASAFAAPDQAIAVKSGTHTVEVRLGSQTLLRQTFYLANDLTKIVDIPGGK